MVYTLSDFIDLTQEQRTIIGVFEADQSLRDTFYLTGGTLLKARGIVPRISNDLDFFTFPGIDGRTFMSQLKKIHTLLVDAFGSEHLVATDRGFIHQTSGMVIDIIADEIKNIDDFVLFGRLRTAGLQDVAASKASALCSRDEIKDFIDIAFLTHQHGWLLNNLEDFAEQKFELKTINEEKLLTELLGKQSQFDIPSTIFLRDPEENTKRVREYIATLIEHTTV